MQIKTNHFFEPHFLSEKLFEIAEMSYEFGSPWTIQQFYEDLLNEYSNYLLLESDQLVGFLGYHSLLDEVEVYNLCVITSEQSQGYATLLMRNLEKKIMEEPYRQIFLEVRCSNKRAYQFYLTKGFEEISRRKNYYSSPVEDAIVMVKKVGIEERNE